MAGAEKEKADRTCRTDRYAARTVYDEETESLNIKGTLTSAGYHVGRVVWKQSEEDMNAVNAMVYAAETFLFMNTDKNFSIEIPDMKGRKAYLACPEYDQLEVYNWKTSHYELMARLEEEINSRISRWDKSRHVLVYIGGITKVADEGLLYRSRVLYTKGNVYSRYPKNSE